MRAYLAKTQELSGTSFSEVRKKAFQIYLSYKRKSKRKPYLRSKYFHKDKIFLDLFWSHLFEQRNFVDLIRRIKFYPCALELLQATRFVPISKDNPNKVDELLHRFLGMTKSGEKFFVQVKEDKKSRKKYLISIFPEQK